MRRPRHLVSVGPWLLAALFCAAADGGPNILTGLKPIELPYPPGERSVRLLLMAPYGKDIRGAVLVPPGEGLRFFFRYDLETKALSLAKVMPEPLGLAQDYVRGKAKAEAANEGPGKKSPASAPRTDDPVATIEQLAHQVRSEVT